MSQLTLNQHSAGVLERLVRHPEQLAATSASARTTSPRRRRGSSRDILFTNEESPDYVFRQEDSWPPPIGDPDGEARPALVVALDVKTGKHHPIYGHGPAQPREQRRRSPGYGKPVVLSGDDTFTSGPLTGAASTPRQCPRSRSSTRTSRRARSALLADKGDLWAFVSDTPGVNDYYDVLPGLGRRQSRALHQGAEEHRDRPEPGRLRDQGRRRGLPRCRRTTAAGRPTSRSSRRRSRHRRSAVGAPALERPEQRVPVRPRRGHRLRQAARHGERRLHRRLGQGPDAAPGPRARQPFRSTNGRVWKMVLDTNDPTKVTSLTVFVEGDDSRRQDAHRDPPAGQPRVDAERHPRHGGPRLEPAVPRRRRRRSRTRRRRGCGTSRSRARPAQVVARVDQSAGRRRRRTSTGRPPGNWGAWESTGIVDASEAFGPGAFLINIQAHTLWIEKAPGDDNYARRSGPTSRTSARAGSCC